MTLLNTDRPRIRPSKMTAICLFMSVPYWDHMCFVHPLTNISVDISTDSRPIYRPMLDRHVGRHIYRHSTYILSEICQSTYWLIYRSIVAQHLTDITADILVDMSTKIFRPRYQSSCGRYVDRYIRQ